MDDHDVLSDDEPLDDVVISDKYIAISLRHKIQQLEQQIALLTKELENRDHVISILKMRTGSQCSSSNAGDSEWI